jgi:hypothetical protein
MEWQQDLRTRLPAGSDIRCVWGGAAAVCATHRRPGTHCSHTRVVRQARFHDCSRPSPPAHSHRLELPFNGGGVVGALAGAAARPLAQALSVDFRTCSDMPIYMELGCTCANVAIEACPADAPEFCRSCTKASRKRLHEPAVRSRMTPCVCNPNAFICTTLAMLEDCRGVCCRAHISAAVLVGVVGLATSSQGHSLTAVCPRALRLLTHHRTGPSRWDLARTVSHWCGSAPLLGGIACCISCSTNFHFCRPHLVHPYPSSPATRTDASCVH